MSCQCACYKYEIVALFMCIYRLNVVCSMRAHAQSHTALMAAGRCGNTRVSMRRAPSSSHQTVAWSAIVSAVSANDQGLVGRIINLSLFLAVSG